jgi:hypothetical protein
MLHHVQRDQESLQYARLALQEKPDLVAARDFLRSLENPGATPPGAVVTVGFEELNQQAGWPN